MRNYFIQSISRLNCMFGESATIGMKSLRKMKRINDIIRNEKSDDSQIYTKILPSPSEEIMLLRDKPNLVTNNDNSAIAPLFVSQTSAIANRIRQKQRISHIEAQKKLRNVILSEKKLTQIIVLIWFLTSLFLWIRLIF